MLTSLRSNLTLWAFAGFLSLILVRSLFQPEVLEHPSSGIINVQDMTGRLVQLDGPARRIMMLAPVSWHYLAVEPTDEFILMIPPYMKREIDLSVLSHIFPHLSQKPITFFDNSTANVFSIEESMLMNPDVVLSWAYLASNFERIKSNGLIKIVADKGEKEDLFRVLGELTDKKHRVDWLMARYNENLNKILSDLPGDIERLNILILDDDGFSLGTEKYYKRFNKNIGLINAFNAAEAEGGKNRNINMESILSIDPDVLFINHYLLAFSTITVPDIYANDKFQGLKAVRNKRVYHMPRGSSRLEGPFEEPLFFLWLLQTLHPELPSNLSLRDEIKKTYLDVFNYMMTEDEVNSWLRLDENLLSEGYSHFI
jgi:iron complex transport system substrate-binding protein